MARRAVSALRRAAAAALTLHVPERALGHLEQALRLTDSGEQRAEHSRPETDQRRLSDELLRETNTVRA